MDSEVYVATCMHCGNKMFSITQAGSQFAMATHETKCWVEEAADAVKLHNSARRMAMARWN